MRKLLLFFAMLCVSIGAWAGQVPFGTNGSWYEIDGTTVTIHVATDHDLGRDNSTVYTTLAAADPAITKIVFDSSSKMSGTDVKSEFINQLSSVETIDFSGVTFTGGSSDYSLMDYTNVKSLILDGVTADKTINIQNNSALESLIVTPTAYTSVTLSGNNANLGVIKNANAGSIEGKWTGTLSTFDTNDMMDFSKNTCTDAKNKTKLQVVGSMSVDDAAAFAETVSAYNGEIRLLDMHGVTLTEDSENEYNNYAFDFGANTNLVTVVLPIGLPDAKKEWFDQCANLYAAMTYDAASPTALRAYVQQEGSLKNAFFDAIKGGGNDVLGSTWTAGESGFGLSRYSTNITKIKLSGNLNAIDIDNDDIDYINAQGHLAFSTEDVAEVFPDTRNLTYSNGHEQCGALKGFKPSELDLSDAKFSYYRDMTISAYAYADNLKKLVLPTDPSMNTIPAYMLNSTFPKMEEICIPSNYEYIKVGAFYLTTGSIKHVWTTGHDNDPTTSTVYDNGAVYAYNKEEVEGYNTFVPTDEGAGWTPEGKTIKWGTFTFSSNLKEIESYAFGTSGYVKDVYVLATEAPECHVDAFNSVMYAGNNSFSPQIIDGIITRDSYVRDEANWITMLHYPRETVTPNTQRYMDQTRKYGIATSEKDGKGGTIYFPSHAEFGRSYVQGTTGFLWNAWDSERDTPTTFTSNGTLGTVPLGWQTGSQDVANAMYNKNESTDKKNQTFYETQQSGVTTTLSPTPNNYWASTWNEGAGDKQLYPQGQDYRGWHQFTLGATATNSNDPFTPYRSYITDNDWWTICTHVDLTKSEVNALFGGGSNATPVHVCKLVSVTRDVTAGTITLNFSNNLMSYKETVAEGKVHGTIGTTKGEVQDNDIVIHKGVPYMIRPNIPAGGPRQFDIYSEDKGAQSTSSRSVVVNSELYNKIVASGELSGSKMEEMIYNGEYQVPALVVNNPATGGEAVTTDRKAIVKGGDGTEIELTIGADVSVSADFTYTFVGSYYNSLLPQYCYFLGWDSDKNRAAFWYNRVADTANFRWANETCIICPNWGDVGSTGKAIDEATGLDSPAQWKIEGLGNDDYPNASSQGAKSMSLMSFDTNYQMNAIDTEATGISQAVGESSRNANKVYNVNGQFVANSLNGLSKGIYVVNGKKVVIK